MKEQFELFLTFLRETRGLLPSQERTMRRQFNHFLLMQEIHRPVSTCGMDVDAYVKDAKERLKRERPEKSDYTPPHTPDWVVGITPTPDPRKIDNHDPDLAEHRDWVAVSNHAPRKDWGKDTVKLINKIKRAQANKLKFEHDYSYALNHDYIEYYPN